MHTLFLVQNLVKGEGFILVKKNTFLFYPTEGLFTGEDKIHSIDEYTQSPEKLNYCLQWKVETEEFALCIWQP